MRSFLLTAVLHAGMQARHVQLFKIFCGAVALVHFTSVRPHSTRLGSARLGWLGCARLALCWPLCACSTVVRSCERVRACERACVCSSCFWAYAGHLEEEEEDGTFTAVWWDKYPHMNWNDAPLNRRYGLCLYWSVMTMSTIGYGDIEPVTSAERLYTLFIMVLGAGFYGWVIGNISALVAVSDPNTRRRNEEMELVTAYIKERNFPKQLAYRIRRYYKFFLSQKTTLNEKKILDKLSMQLRKEATDFLVDGVVKEHPAFRSLSPHGMSLLHLVLRPVQIPKGAVLCRCGDLSYEGYLLLSGTVEVRAKDGKVLAYVEAGSLVGELAMVRRRAYVPAPLPSPFLLLPSRPRLFVRSCPELHAARCADAVSTQTGARCVEWRRFGRSA